MHMPFSEPRASMTPNEVDQVLGTDAVNKARARAALAASLRTKPHWIWKLLNSGVIICLIPTIGVGIVTRQYQLWERRHDSAVTLDQMDEEVKTRITRFNDAV